MAEYDYRPVLNTIDSNIRRLSVQIDGVSQEVVAVNGMVQDVDSRLLALVQEFQEFVHRDMMQKEIQLAETRVVKVRQELTDKYGHYDEVRRIGTGILQAADVSLVRQSVVNDCTEELMLKTPRYWLAPCLIALAAWLNDNRDLADRALQEAIRRNDERTSLFFALVTRRARRHVGCERWLERYFAMQDPTALERDMVIVLDAFACGLLGSDSTGECSRRIQEWIAELSSRPGFVEEQQNRWAQAMRTKAPVLGQEEYPNLKKYSPTWPQLQFAMQGARLHAELKNHFTEVFSGELPVSKALAVRIDEILDNLVTNFDEEELPLRRDERLLSLIIECQGDRAVAQSKMDAEKALEQNVDFMQLLTNAAMHPEASGASKATQRLSIALTKDWIKSAYNDLTATVRAGTPSEIGISINDWTGTTRDGENEAQLLQSMNDHINRWQAAALAKLKIGTGHYVALATLGLIAVVSLFSQTWWLAVLAILGGAGYYVFTDSSLKGQRQSVAQQHSQLQDTMPKILRAVLAEIVDWRREWAQMDAVSEETNRILDEISPAQFVSNSYSSARMVL